MVAEWDEHARRAHDRENGRYGCGRDRGHGREDARACTHSNRKHAGAAIERSY